jgi:hypothetical protein
MKSAGEAMAIGRTFNESLQKCRRSLGTRWPCSQHRIGLGGDGKPRRIGTESKRAGREILHSAG